MSVKASIVEPSTSSLRPLPHDAIDLTGGFWGRRQQRNWHATIPHVDDWMSRLGWIGNFPAAAQGRQPGGRHGREFTDANVYNLIEALVWEHPRHPGDSAARADELIGTVAAAQEADGYLNTRFGHQGAALRYRDLEWGHELFCYGHLIQAGVAALRTQRCEQLADVALRAADHVVREFSPAGPMHGICGHPGIEMALVELYRATGAERYLAQARTFIERRGTGTLGDIEFGAAYFQDDLPVRQASVLRGHAVRALYLSAGAVDVAVETGDAELLGAVTDQLDATLATRTYLTGGMGSRHKDEAFGADFELPPDRAYAETCAGIATVMLAWRLLLATGHAKYADLIERELYNVIAGATDRQGTSFFYTNTLQLREAQAWPETALAPSPRAAGASRSPWFTVSCCPTNLVRTYAALPMYIATADGGGIQVHQYALSRITCEQRRIVVDTDYPVTGRVAVTIEASTAAPWVLSLRIPSWCASARVAVNGASQPASPGYLHLQREWAPGDVVVLTLPLAPRWTHPDPRIDALRDTAAVERGPVVYCLEEGKEPDLDEISVDPATAPSEAPGGEIPAVTTTATCLAAPPASWPYYGSRPPARARPSTVHLIPYYDRANEGPSRMRVFLPVTPSRREDQDDVCPAGHRPLRAPR